MQSPGVSLYVCLLITIMCLLIRQTGAGDSEGFWERVRGGGVLGKTVIQCVPALKRKCYTHILYSGNVPRDLKLQGLSWAVTHLLMLKTPGDSLLGSFVSNLVSNQQGAIRHILSLSLAPSSFIRHHQTLKIGPRPF